MAEPVKRAYSSQLRETQAQQTRRAIVDAGARLFVERGFGLTTIDDIAAEAGVSRKTVFSSVGGKVDILKLALDWAVVGDDEPVPLLERPPIKAAEAANDPQLSIQTWVDIVSSAASRVAALSLVLMSAAGVDEQAQELRDSLAQQRLFGSRHFIEMLARQGGLRDDLTVEEAIDIAYTYNDPLLFFRLVLDRRWPIEQYKRWLRRTITFHLTGIAAD